MKENYLISFRVVHTTTQTATGHHLNKVKLFGDEIWSIRITSLAPLSEMPLKQDIILAAAQI